MFHHNRGTLRLCRQENVNAGQTYEWILSHGYDEWACCLFAVAAFSSRHKVRDIIGMILVPYHLFQILYTNLSWRSTDKVLVLPCLTYFNTIYCPLLKLYFSRLFSTISSDVVIWIWLDVIRIKSEFCRAWPTFTWVIALCYVFRIFLCHLFRFWLEIWNMNWSWHNTNNVTKIAHLEFVAAGAFVYQSTFLGSFLGCILFVEAGREHYWSSTNVRRSVCNKIICVMSIQIFAVIYNMCWILCVGGFYCL